MGVQDLTIGSGSVAIDGAAVGNCPSFVFAQDATIKTRMKVVGGVRYPGGAYTVERNGVLKFTLDSWSDEVLALARDGRDGALVTITQAQAYGPRRVYTFPAVNIKPAQELRLVSEGDFSVLEFEGQAIFDDLGRAFTVEDAA